MPLLTDEQRSQVFMNKYLGKHVQVILSTSRRFEGQLVAIDYQGFLLLNNSYEVLNHACGTLISKELQGVINIPKNLISNVYICQE